MRNDWTKEEVLAEKPPIPVTVEGHPLATTGEVVPDGNNVFVVVYTGVKYVNQKMLVEKKFGWDAVLQALNEKFIRLPLDPAYPTRPPATPDNGMDFLFPKRRPKVTANS